MRVAVIGRPNVGQVVVREPAARRGAAGGARRRRARRATRSTRRCATRSAISIFVDTAGLRRQSKIDDGVEFYSSLRTRRAIDSSDVCILMIDATEGLQNQDLKIATLAWEAGRGLIIVVNKWDVYEDKTDKSAAKFRKESIEKAPYLEFVPFLFTSAKTGQRVTKVLDLVLAGAGAARSGASARRR